MKKRGLLLILLVMLLSISACGETQKIVGNDIEVEETKASTEVSEPQQSEQATVEEEQSASTEQQVMPTEESNQPDEVISSFSIDIEGVSTIDELEIRIEEHLDGLLESLGSRWKTLAAETDTYDKYCDNATKVSDFYQTIADETNQMCIMLFDYSAVYARMILDADMSNEEKYEAIDGINDCLYKDACDKIHDEVYKGILDKMNDYYYDGILEDAQDETDYSEWYDVYSDEYSQWYDTGSDVYSTYYDAASDIYAFYYDLSGELYAGDMERAEKTYEKFLHKIDKAKGIGSMEGTDADANLDTAILMASSVDELEATVDAHVSECIQALRSEWAGVSQEIDTFEKYVEQIDKVEEFHTYIEDSSNQILVMICEYGVSYAELIMQSDSTSKDKYKSFEDLKDCIYEDACEQIKDDIYDGILNDIKDYYYEGIVNDAKDSVEYGDWADARSDAYSWWADARSEVYSSWSDTRGDIYNFFTDMRSELYSGDIDRANEVLQKFKEKVEKKQ